MDCTGSEEWLIQANDMKRLVLYSAMVLLVIGCRDKPKVSREERNKAFNRALDFSEVAFFERDYPKAYLLVSKDCKATFEEFCGGIDKVHPKGFPTSIKAIEYEPVPGEEKIKIYLYGRNNDQKFYYQLVMQRMEKLDYKVLSLERSSHRYPTSKLRERLRTISPVIRYKKR